jgi:hypothetical protein
MRIVALLAASLVLPACIIVPPQNVCVVPTPAVGAGTTGSPAPGASAAPGGTTTGGTTTGGTTTGGTTTGGTTTGGTTTVGGGGTVTTSPPPAAVASAGAQATTLRVSTGLPGDPRTVTLVPGTPLKLTATATDANGQPIAGVTFRYDPDAGTSANAVVLDNAGNVQVTTPPPASARGTIRVVTPSGQASSDADSIRVTIGL